MNIDKIKNKIRKNFVGEYAINILHCIECKLMPAIIDDETAVKKFYTKRTGKQLNLDNPQTFTEKMNWYKLNSSNPLMQQCADKVGLREYVTSKGYGDNLNEIYGVYNNVKDIDINSFPECFVLKAAHGSHMGLIVKDKSTVNWRKEKIMMKTWLHQDIAWSGREWVYKDMPKRIVAEKYLEDASGELRDYKFFCFNGKPTYMQIDIGRYRGTHYRNYYDMDMNYIPVSDDCPQKEDLEISIDKTVLDEMRKIATDLSQPFQFVRVDFYYVDNKILIGEMTFFHNGGVSWFEPESYDYEFGRQWVLCNENGKQIK